jgi:transcriptional regulator with XRE-family HTH domain
MPHPETALARWRADVGTTLSELARISGLDRTTLRRCERDRYGLSAGALLRLAEVTGLQPEALLSSAEREMLRGYRESEDLSVRRVGRPMRYATAAHVVEADLDRAELRELIAEVRGTVSEP